MRSDDPTDLRSWIAPGVILAAISVVFVVVSWQFSAVHDRLGAIEQRELTTASNISAADAKIDRAAESIRGRVEQVNERIDRVLEAQTETVARIMALQGRVEQIAQRLVH